jgi:hypothetical protein
MADSINTKTLAIEPEMLGIIAELDEFNGAWRALSTLAPERLSALRRVATIESIGSPEAPDQGRLSRAVWQGKGHVVFAAMIRSRRRRQAEQNATRSAVFIGQKR